MRIISGSHKGRTINPPSNLPVRPTTDYAKTALFNILNNYIDFENISVLDLFSGTGNISFEFSSRGAKEIVSVDASYACIVFIKAAAEKFGFVNLKTVKADVFNFLGKTDKKYDLVFADPPYEMKGSERLPDLIFQNNILAANGLFILEHSVKTDFSKHPNFVEKREYGAVNFSFFK